MKSKICGISDIKTLRFITNHSFPPKFIGFIVNYIKSKRYVSQKNLNKLLKINKFSNISYEKINLIEFQKSKK